VESVMDVQEAFEKCEELFAQYGVSEEDQGWFVLAFESLCIQALIMKGGPFYERYTAALAEHALEDAELEVLIQHERSELAEMDAIIEAMKKAKEAEEWFWAVYADEIGD
jgi:hypothetical protein